MSDQPKSIEKIHVPLGDRSYDIHIAPGLLDGSENPVIEVLRRQVEKRPALIVADSNTVSLGGEKIRLLIENLSAASCAIHTFPAGELSKNFKTVEEICSAAANARLDRSGLIIALGGGVTGDMAGFAASIYMRGIRFLQIPTSLLAMIDSSVGGKTGVDLPEGKNLIGTFYQPKLVLMDVNFLKTLPADQLRSGYAELIKHAILFDPELFTILHTNAEKLMPLTDFPLAARLIARSCALKAGVVAEDEHEGSLRALLNLGHSFGHAVEKLQNFCGWSHGEAVAFGIAVAAILSVRIGMMKESDCRKIQQLLREYGLPLSVSGLKPEDIYRTMLGDKKNIGGKIRLILPHCIGKCEIMADLPEKEILASIGDCCG